MVSLNKNSNRIKKFLNFLSGPGQDGSIRWLVSHLQSHSYVTYGQPDIDYSSKLAIYHSSSIGICTKIPSVSSGFIKSYLLSC